MFYTKIFPKTRREAPKDAISPATKLLIHGGFIEQVSRGIWIMTPLGLKVRRNVENIVRDEMNRIDAVELELPILQPKELWDETKRWDRYTRDQIAFHLRDRKNVEYILAPTAEEVMTDFARNNVRTIKDLPITFWQMSPKFRDEVRPRQGIVRGREFVMKDAYSFDKDKEGMILSFEKMEQAYHRIFTRCHFDYIKVEADSGSIGGSGSAEFMAITEYGEDVLLCCSNCGYGGNQEKAVAFFPPYSEVALLPLKEIATPDVKTVEQLESFTGVSPKQMVKTIVLLADGNPVIVSMRGDLEISEIKLARLMNAEVIEVATPEVVERVTQAPVGFAGPINLFGKTTTPYYFDESVRGLRNFLCGANKTDIHFVEVNSGRDFPEIENFYDLSKVITGQMCSSCKNGTLEEKRGIELGHIFQLQQAYSLPMNATYNDGGTDVLYWMGCYGVGVSRIVQTIVEQKYDEKGIIWPLALSPFKAIIIPVHYEKHYADALSLYQELKSLGVDVLFDDRDARIGEKLTDAELQGWPLQIIVGRSWDAEKKLEVQYRDSKTYDTSFFSIEKENSLPKAIVGKDELIKFIHTIK